VKTRNQRLIHSHQQHRIKHGFAFEQMGGTASYALPHAILPLRIKDSRDFRAREFKRHTLSRRTRYNDHGLAPDTQRATHGVTKQR
jgi:hypothetical protein